MPTMVPLLRNMSPKAKAYAIGSTCLFAFYATFVPSPSEMSEMYSAYQERKEIARIDSVKKELVDSNSKEISESRSRIRELTERISFLETCNSKVKFGTKEEFTCDSVKHLVPQAKAEELSFTGNEPETESPKELPPKSKALLPEELFYVTRVSDGCHVSQTEESHYEKRNGGMLATDVACRFGQPKAQRATVFAPDYSGKSVLYTVKKVGNNNLLGNYAELEFCPTDECLVPMKWVIAHLETKKKEGDTLSTGEVLGQTDLSGATTGYHSHVELWANVNGQWTNVSYTTRSKSLDNRRNGKLDDTVKKGDPIYFTHYHLGDVTQNDASPCTGASGKDLCALARNGIATIALTKDVRELYGIKFGDRVRLDGDPSCSGTYEVHDEKNVRYRTACERIGSACNKGDIAVGIAHKQDGKLVWDYELKPGCKGGIYKVTKL